MFWCQDEKHFNQHLHCGALHFFFFHYYTLLFLSLLSVSLCRETLLLFPQRKHRQPCPACSLLALSLKGPQISRPPDDSPGGASLTTTQLHLIHTHSLASQTRATYSSSLVDAVILFCIMCASGPFHSGLFWLQSLHGKKRSLLACLAWDCQLRATVTTFTHADSGLLCRRN